MAPPRFKAGAILYDDDPLLDTTKLPEEFREKHALVARDQHAKTIPAPDDARVSPEVHPRASRVYTELGYKGPPFEPSDDHQKMREVARKRREAWNRAEPARGGRSLIAPKLDDDVPPTTEEEYTIEEETDDG